jgi:tetratricopeptide (TPR) repeat protein
MRGMAVVEKKGNRDLLIEKLGAVILAIGACLCVWVFGRGNQEIFALPLAFWLCVSFWPQSVKQVEKTSRAADVQRRWRRGLLISGIAGSWIAVLFGVRFPIRAPIVPAINPQARIEADLSRAEQDYERRKYEKAIERLDRLTIPGQFPTLKARWAHDRGIAQLRLGNKAAASDSFVQALKYDPKNVEALCLLSEIALAQGDQSAARSYLDRALAIDQSYAFARKLTNRVKEGNQPSSKPTKP